MRSMRSVGRGIRMFVLLACAAAPFSAAAQQPTYGLEEMKVVAAPVIQGNRLDRYASQKTEVTEEQIRDLNAQDVAAALRRTPGVNISRYNPIGSFGGAEGGGVFIRGQGSSRPGAEIKTLVDGVPMYMSLWNHPLLDLLSIDSAHTIEVYKSPQPHVFGNAFAVVNLVPKRIEAEGFQTRIQAAGGSYDTFVASGDHGGKTGAWDYFVGGGYRTSEGHRNDADGELRDFFGRIGYRLNPHWSLSLFALWNDNEAKDPGAKGAPAAARLGTYETRSLVTTLTASHRYEQVEGFLKLYRNGGEGDWRDQPVGATIEDLYNDFLFYGLKGREVFRLWPGGVVIAGLDWDRTEGDYTKKISTGARDKWNGEDFVLFSPYLAASQLIGSREGLFAIPSAGIRHYDNTEFDAEWAPHVGLILGYRDTELHAGYSRGVIYPGLDVIVFSEKVTPALRDTWKKLNAATVDHYEVGLRHRLGRLAVADVTFFYDDGKDRYVVVPPPPPPPKYGNVETYRIKGVEATLTLFPFADLALFGGVTLLETDPADLPYAPDFTASAGLNFRFLERFRLSLDCQYLSDFHVLSQARRLNAANAQEADEFLVVNGKIAYGFDLPAWKASGELFVAGENLTDTNYAYRPGYPMPGINGMAGVQLRF